MNSDTDKQKVKKGRKSEQNEYAVSCYLLFTQLLISVYQ